MIALRLDKSLEQRISEMAQQMGVSKSELVRRSVVAFIEQQPAPDAYTLGQDLFGRQGSGQGDLSVEVKNKLKDKLRAKHG